MELLELAVAELRDDVPRLVRERGDDGVAGEPEPSVVRLVVEVTTRSSIGEVEACPVGQRFTPKRSVVAVQCVAVGIGVFAWGRVGLDVIRRVDHAVVQRARPARRSRRRSGGAACGLGTGEMVGAVDP